MYRILIVEDEQDEQETLTRHLMRYGQATGERFQVKWMRTATEFLQSKARYDLVFLDIDLPGVNGMEAAQLLRVYDEKTPVFFVTNLAKYAIRGYEVDALDFMVKPLTYAGFALRMDKALAVMRQNSPRSLCVPTHDGQRFVPLSSISFLKIDNNLITYRLEGDESVTARGSLAQAERDLEGASFVRVSRNCLANMAMVHTISPAGLVMTTGETLRFSRARRKDALRAVTEYWGGV